jgi:hypothetical protein
MPLGSLVKLLWANEFFLGSDVDFPVPPNDLWVEQATSAVHNQ